MHGHRGAAAVRPENTLDAFEYAIGVGVDAIEMDIAVTRDDVPVVSHDPWVADRTAIRGIAFAELRRRSPSVPSLAEVLDLAGRGEFVFNIEIKSYPDRPDLAPAPDGFAALVVAEIDRHGIRGRSMLQSFDFRILREAELQAPEIPRGALFEEGTDLAAIAKEAHAGIAVPEFHLVAQERVEAAHAAGISVYTWTADEPGDWRALVEARVDAIITNDPAGLLAYLGRGSR